MASTTDLCLKLPTVRLSLQTQLIAKIFFSCEVFFIHSFMSYNTFVVYIVFFKKHQKPNLMFCIYFFMNFSRASLDSQQKILEKSLILFSNSLKFAFYLKNRPEVARYISMNNSTVWRFLLLPL